MRRARPWVLLCAIGAIGLVWKVAEDRAVTDEPNGALSRPVIPYLRSATNSLRRGWHRIN